MTAGAVAGTGRRRARRVDLRAGRDDLVDAAFVLVLGLGALAGFRSTFDGWQFLLVGGVGLVLGVLAGHVAVGLRAPALTVAVMAVGAFFLLGGAVALRGETIAGVVPTPAALTGLADLSVHGWKQLLTTLPPVDGSGPLLAIPYLLGLIAGAGAHTLARRVARVWPPVVALVALLIAVILLGTVRPGAPLVQGAPFAAVALAWAGVRAGRRRPVAGRGSGRVVQGATAAVLLVAAGGLAAATVAVLPADPGSRVVLRQHVQPPFDIGQYASPLTGFRKYTEHAKLVWNEPLLTVTGLPQGQLLRFATLDGYDGAVWGASGASAQIPGDATNAFQRVGTRIDSGATGRAVSVTLTVEPKYAEQPDLRAWVPTAGTVTGVRFEGDREAALADGLRYDLATGSGVTSALLRPGDRVRFTTVLDRPQLTASDVAAGAPTVDGGVDGFVAGASTALAGPDATGGVATLLAIGATMKRTGAYSDGGLPGEQFYLPGHSTGRLLDFLNRQQLVGTDEHYAATFALIANHLGMPARVVLGALPEADGTVKGKDVHAWVEVRTGVDRWATVPWTVFMPATSKRPETQPPPKVQKANPAVVPPPNVTRPLSSLDQAAQLEANSQRLGRRNSVGDGAGVPAWLVALATYGGTPLGSVLAVAGGIVTAKGMRRRRRRNRRVFADRYGSGWREVLDTWRDLGRRPVGVTRREQAAGFDDDGLRRLAAAADAGTFGPEAPDEAVTTAFWADVDAARASALAGVSRRRRLLAAVDPRTLWPRRAVRA